MEELQKLGLAQNGRVELDQDDLEAMLSGRRTDMLRLENLSSDGMRIDVLDAKLSLREQPKGGLELLLHRIQKSTRLDVWHAHGNHRALKLGQRLFILLSIGTRWLLALRPHF